MKEIGLTQGKIAIVDAEDFERLNQFKWHAIWDGWNWYAIRKYRENDKRRTMFMHRKILDAQKGTITDHINGNGLYNCKKNLRLCTTQENAFNRKHATKKNKIGIKGVHWRKDIKKFVTIIKINYKQIFLGSFNVLGDADSVYRKAEEKYFGEFARK